MLNPEFKEKWVTALESGKYQQAKGVLYDGNGYCCLGVACIVAGATFEDGLNSQGKDYMAPKIGDTVLANPDDTGVLSQEFRDQIGLSFEEQGKLWRMNDGESTFPEIADYIKKFL